MIELSRTKTTPLGIIGGRKKFAVHASIAPLMMRDASNLSWEDINPSFVIVGTKRVSQGTPYRIEIDGQGDRIIYPDRTDLSKYIHLPTNSLFRTLPKTWGVASVSAQSSKLNVQFGLDNSRTSFKTLFQQDPKLAGSQLKLDYECVGLDIIKLLSSPNGIGIPRPRLIDAKGLERILEWKPVSGQLVLDLDFSGMAFPVLLLNTTIDLDIAATADDGQYAPTLGQIQTTAGSNVFGHVSTYPFHEWYRFDGISWDADCDIQPGAYIRMTCRTSDSTTTVNARVFCDNNSDPAAPTSAAEAATVFGRATTAYADWPNVPAITANTTYDTPDLEAVLQELVNDNGAYASQAVQVLVMDNGSSTDAIRNAYDLSYGSGMAHLHFEWSAGGGGAAYIPKVFFF